MFKNAFHTLDMPIQMNLCLETLEAHYLTYAAQMHPDRFAHPFEKQAATQKSADLNTAYQMLKNPITRAAEILRAHNMTIPGEKSHTILDADILQETMHWQETIAQWKKDPKATQNSIKHIQESLSGIYQELIQTFDTRPSEEWSKIYVRLCYLEKLLQRCQEEVSIKAAPNKKELH